MHYVQSAVPPLATVHAWSESEDCDGIGTPCMLLDWIEGSTLEWNTPSPLARDKVLIYRDGEELPHPAIGCLLMSSWPMSP